MVDNDYLPQTITVARGSTLTWSNTGSLPHTVTDRAGGFDSGIVMPGDAYRRTFASAGSFEYFCTIHPEMSGTVVVTESGTPVGVEAGGDGLLTGGDDVASDESPSLAGDASPPAQASVDVIDNDFDPSPLRVAVGALVTWTNIGDLPHTVTGDGFDSGIMNPGDGFEWTFDRAGTFDYVCALHPGMAGRIIVEAVAATDAALGAADGSTSGSAGSSPGNSVAFAVFMAGGLAVAGVGMAVGVGRFAKAMENGSL